MERLKKINSWHSGGTGRRERLKIVFSKESEGSNPFCATTFTNDFPTCYAGSNLHWEGAMPNVYGAVYVYDDDQVKIGVDPKGRVQIEFENQRNSVPIRFNGGSFSRLVSAIKKYDRR